MRLDVSESDEVLATVDTAIEESGHVFVLVNNAGYGSLGTLEEVSDEEIRRQFEVNFLGPLNVRRAVLPHMREQRSDHFVNFSSIGGF